MSAKRLKIEGSRTSKRTNPDDASPSFRRGRNQQSTSSSTTNEPATNSPFLLSNDGLKKIDSAIQMRLKMNRALQNRLTFDDFYGLLRKIKLDDHLHSAPSARQLNAAGDDNGLSVNERVLYELLFVLSPSLYKIYRGPNLFQKNMPCWFVESTYSGRSWSRNDELGRCLQKRLAETTNEASKSLLESITNHRAEKQAQKAAIQALHAPTLKEILKVDSRETSVIQPGMTIDERVQARASAKRTRTEESKREEPDSSTHRALLVQVAHGLWQHSTFILGKRQRIMSPASKSRASSSLVLTLKDAVESLKRTLSLGTGSSDSISKRQLVGAIKDLCQIVPEFIAVTSEDSSKEFTKNATLWLNASTYISAQAKLAGKEVDDDRKPMASAVALLSSNSMSLVKSGPIMSVLKLEQMASPKHEPATGLVVTADTQNETFGAASVAGQRMMATGTKRVALDDEHPSQKKKQKSDLRINPNLILSPADHTGGEILDVRPLHESPRGLKQLLAQMKAGQRI